MLHLIAALVVSASLMPSGKQLYTDSAGAPLAGGRVYTYAAGTTTPLATYSDKAGTIPNTNPVILDARGEATIFWAPAGYKVVLKDSADVTVWTQDEMYPPVNHGSDLNGALVTATGSSTARSMRDRWADTINVRDFGATGDGATDDTAAVQAALDAARPGTRVFFPAGRYIVSASLVPPKTLTNGGAWGSVMIEGQGNSWVDDLFSAPATNHATTIYVTAPVSGTPVFLINQTRGVRFRNLNIVGSYPVTAGSVAVRLVNYNKLTSFESVTFAGWDEAVQIGAPGETVSGNNDELIFRDCFFLKGTTGISNYGIESYAVRASDSTFWTDTGYLTTSHTDGTAMNSFKAFRCNFFGSYVARAHTTHATGSLSGRDIIVLDSILFEPGSGANAYGQVFISDAANAYNDFGLIIRNSTLNLGTDAAAVYDPAFRVIRYYGRGPLEITGNIIGGLGRIPIEIVTNGSGWNDGSIEVRDNVFTTARPTFIRPSGGPLPSIWEVGNQVKAEAHLNLADPYLVSYQLGETAVPIVRGKRLGGLPPRDYETWRVGSTYTDAATYTTEAICRQSGTQGSISGVTADVNYLSTTATITGGAIAEQRKIHQGSFIKFGANGPFEVMDAIGTTIYLHDPYWGAATTSSAVDYSAPVFQKTSYGWDAAPTSTTTAWTAGDVVWFGASGGGTPGAYCTASGSPGTWEIIPRQPNRSMNGGVSTHTINAATTDVYTVSMSAGQITPGYDFTVEAPSNPPTTETGTTLSRTKRITVIIKNATGGSCGVPTWNAVFHLAAWTNPPDGFSKAITFAWDGSAWVEESRTGDVPN